MRYFSLKRVSPEVSFKEAVIQGLAPDKGLYFPKSIKPLPQYIFDYINSFTHDELAYAAIQQFVSPDIPKDKLLNIVQETLSFDFPVKTFNENISVLELFHGPTMAFKDVGARFMARCLGYFNHDNNREVTVLVATSGDTGAAVAHGFLGVKGVNVVILYPSGKVSDVQEKQLTALGQNITALEVKGTFDDCQAMVKTAFLDESLTKKMQLTSANSINVARWLPQMFYFLFAYKALHNKFENIVFSVPSGNFGNICAGLMARELGLPVEHYIAANNRNDTITNYFKSKEYNPKPAIQTISNAMDVGDPSNFVRIEEIFDGDFEALKNHMCSFSFDDEQTKAGMQELFEKYQYVADPHGAVGYLGARAYLENNPTAHTVFLETAHPAKFLDVVEEVTQTKQTLPSQIETVMHKEKRSTQISTYEELKEFLLSHE